VAFGVVSEREIDEDVGIQDNKDKCGYALKVVKMSD
jgi:hypothetical protein